VKIDRRTLQENWKIWGMPAWIPILAPLQRKVIGLNLIPDSYQPHLDAFCVLSGALSAMFVCALFADATKAAKRTAAICLVGAIVVSMVLLRVFTTTVDIIWTPGVVWGPIIDVVWPLAYMLTFMGFGGLVIVLLLLRSGP